MNEKDKAFAFRCLTNVFNQVDVADVCDEQQILLIANLSTQEMSMAKLCFYFYWVIKSPPLCFMGFIVLRLFRLLGFSDLCICMLFLFRLMAILILGC